MWLETARISLNENIFNALRFDKLPISRLLQTDSTCYFLYFSTTIRVNLIYNYIHNFIMESNFVQKIKYMQIKFCTKKIKKNTYINFSFHIKAFYQIWKMGFEWHYFLYNNLLIVKIDQVANSLKILSINFYKSITKRNHLPLTTNNPYL